jgi:hypothetical protein
MLGGLYPFFKSIGKIFCNLILFLLPSISNTIRIYNKV